MRVAGFPAGLSPVACVPMPQQPSDRRADTQVSIHPPIADRWSPRAFDPDALLTTEQVTALLEAARWAATWGRRQPVRFVVGLRRGVGAERPGDDTFETLCGLLNRGNSYAHSAGALILLCADRGDDEVTAQYCAVDAGAAMANLAIEAVSRGLVSHPMAGFDADRARVAFDIPPQVQLFVVIAVGSLADHAAVSADIADRDATPRKRLPLKDVAFRETWGEPWRA